MDTNRTSTVPIVPKQYRLPFFMLVSCFALWGLLNNMTDNLVPAFSKIFMINASESAGVQISFYGAYAVLAIFASILLEEFSYKAGVLIGLGFYMIGALCYIPAAIGQSFDIYLMAIFVLAGGLSILETTCNPFVLSMGSQETSVRRLNFAQAFNPIGSLTGIFLAKYFILSHLNDADMDARKAMDPEQLNAIVSDELFWVCVPYVGLVAIAGVIWFFFCRYKSDDETVPTLENTRPLSSKLGRLGLCIAFILVPFLFQYYSSFEFSMVQQILIMMIGPIAFLIIMPDYRCQLMKLIASRYTCGVVAQFFYVGVQIAVWTWTIKYIMSVFPGMPGSGRLQLLHLLHHPLHRLPRHHHGPDEEIQPGQHDGALRRCRHSLLPGNHVPAQGNLRLDAGCHFRLHVPDVPDHLRHRPARPGVGSQAGRGGPDHGHSGRRGHHPVHGLLH